MVIELSPVYVFLLVEISKILLSQEVLKTKRDRRLCVWDYNLIIKGPKIPKIITFLTKNAH